MTASGKEAPADLKVFITTRASTCDECREELGRRAWITLAADKGALCLACADLDHLVFLPSGDPALTRRAKKHSELSAIVLKWVQARRRYERQGLLVEEAALERAEQECLEDADARERRRQRRAEREQQIDREYVDRFAKRTRGLFPACPPQREMRIAEHACLKHSGRVGRSADAKALDEKAVLLAVAAHVRHMETDYGRLLAAGWERWEARESVQPAVEAILRRWSGRS